MIRFIAVCISILAFISWINATIIVNLLVNLHHDIFAAIYFGFNFLITLILLVVSTNLLKMKGEERI